MHRKLAKRLGEPHKTVAWLTLANATICVSKRRAFDVRLVLSETFFPFPLNYDWETPAYKRRTYRSQHLILWENLH